MTTPRLLSLASQVPAFDQNYAKDIDLAKSLQYAVVAGAVTGGGLTVIANAPNPAGQSLLNRFFKGGISPLNLFLSALFAYLNYGSCVYYSIGPCRLGDDNG